MSTARYFVIAMLTVWAPSALTAETLTFTGASSRSWFDVGNWNVFATGQPAGAIPGATDDVVVDGVTLEVPSSFASPASVQFNNLSLLNNAILNLNEGALFTLNAASGDGTASLNTFSAGVQPAGGFASVGGSMRLNPSALSSTAAVATGSVTTFFGLGGTTPASIGSYGSGHYATISSPDVQLQGDIDVGLFYGFVPTAGDSFLIVDVGTSLTGTFANAAEGAAIARFGDVDLTITYTGGDGNDVALNAVAVPEPAAFAGLLGLSVFVIAMRRNRR
ncbi:MAG: PEP-CTERM sorting domain-containing protein [Verrucomicrobiota bacterium]